MRSGFSLNTTSLYDESDSFKHTLHKEGYEEYKVRDAPDCAAHTLRETSITTTYYCSTDLTFKVFRAGSVKPFSSSC